MKTIICPVDFSECSENGALYASELAKEFNSRLILLHVYESPVGFTDSSLIDVNSIDQDIQHNARININKLKDKLQIGNKKIRIETLIKNGNAANHICSVAADEGADLIIMGATSKSKAARTLVGSTSMQVISRSHCAVLCIPKLLKYAGIKKIVFATDLNEDNMKAALLIVAFAKHFNAEIIFVYVDYKDLVHSDELISKMTKQIRSHIRYSKMAGYVVNENNVTGGIEFFMKKHPVDLLVMFMHEKHFAQTLLKQGITRKMALKTNIPLLALPVSAHTLAVVS